MDFCIVLEFFIPHYNGGGEHRCYEIAKRLVQRGHNVDVLTMKIARDKTIENIDGINVHHIGPKVKIFLLEHILILLDTSLVLDIGY